MFIITAEIAILCLEVFICRIIDVSLGTIRMMLTVQGKSHWAAAVGFVEMMLWFMIVREALNTASDSVWTAIAFAGGFAVGTYVGGVVARNVIKRNIIVEIVTSNRNEELIRLLRKKGFAVSVVNVNSSEYGEEKYMLFVEIGSQHLKELKTVVNSIDEKAFIMVQDTKQVYNGFMKK